MSVAKRLKRLNSCIKCNDMKRFKYYVKKKKYIKLHLESATINKRQETMLHAACRLRKPEVVQYVLKYSLYTKSLKDHKGNLPLHLALIAVLSIDTKDEFVKAYKDLILAHLKDLIVPLSEINDDGVSVGFLLDTADSVYQHHLSKVSKLTGVKKEVTEEEEWDRKIQAEADYEYESSWGRYEQDFAETDQSESETYDSWAERMINEHRKKSTSFRIPLPPKPEPKPSWTPQDQEQFLRQEEKKRTQQQSEKAAQLRLKFLTKLSSMIQSSQLINENDLPFNCRESVESICQHILFSVKEISDNEERRKSLRELKRLWHPDKFAQKFGQRLQTEIRESVLKKVTEIAQYLNAFDCSNVVVK